MSAKLQCAMKEYFHPDIRLGAGRTMKKVNAYAYGMKKPGGGFSGYVFRATKTSPGPEWALADGVTFPLTAYGRLYKTAFEAGYRELRGERANAAPKTLNGNLTSFEMSLLVAGHEAVHLRRAGVSELEAEWYGIDAVLRYREDKGKACSKEDPPPK
ncbi:hypothetical protein [Stenotrophomonas sp. ATCM1_4]|uniref:hypothetical protein n=1 Tax=Stenotrophomonas sp. ATCM1_4 TaxID=2259330 RepID=UPI001404FECD|nr:hypothetical protein [Stenotrophomonas sp. ATCM1_4]